MRVSGVLVTGGTGVLGREVVDCLRAAGSAVRALSRSGRPGTVQGDLLTGAGLDRAVDGVDTIVHCASDSRKARQADLGGTERLLRAALRAGVSHVVYVSIVGIDRNPFPYYQVKLETERVIERSAVPWTILRATQFHDFVLSLIQLLERGPLAVVPRGFLLQPIDAGEVAGRLVELALSEPRRGRVSDVGGPEVRTVAELARSYLEVTGRKRRILEIPLPGKVARAFREGAQVCPDQRYGRISWEQFLRARFDPAAAQVRSAYDRGR